MKKDSQKNQHDQHDDYNMPTEPMPDLSSMHFPSPDQNSFMPGDRTVPASPPQYPMQQIPPTYPTYPYRYPYTPENGVERYPYPYVPGNPPATVGRPYGIPPGNDAWNPGNARNQRVRQRTFLPTCVGLFFVCIQLLLVVRVAIRILNLSPVITWVGVVTGVSEVFVAPFQAIWFQISSVATLFPANIEVYTLIAILIYGVLSRLLVHILKVILNGR